MPLCINVIKCVYKVEIETVKYDGALAIVSTSGAVAMECSLLCYVSAQLQYPRKLMMLEFGLVEFQASTTNFTKVISFKGNVKSLEFAHAHDYKFK